MVADSGIDAEKGYLGLVTAMEAVIRGGDPEYMRKAVRDFLKAAGEYRSDLVYGWDGTREGTRRRNGIRALDNEIADGRVVYPFTAEGMPMVPDHMYRRPNGSRGVVDHITLMSPRIKGGCEVTFRDGEVAAGRLSGYRIVGRDR